MAKGFPKPSNDTRNKPVGKGKPPASQASPFGKGGKPPAKGGAKK